jgi:hypothetical protein
MNIEKYAGVTQRAIDDGMVKIGVPADSGPIAREWCFAKRISPTHAKLMNCCVHADAVNFGDIVEFREQGDDDGGPHELLKSFVRVVTRGSTQCEFLYSTDDEARDKSPAMQSTLSHRLNRIRAALEELPEDVRPICVEGLFAGFACAAFPVTVTSEQAEAFVAACPFVLDQHSGE